MGYRLQGRSCLDGNPTMGFRLSTNTYTANGNLREADCSLSNRNTRYQVVTVKKDSGDGYIHTYAESKSSEMSIGGRNWILNKYVKDGGPDVHVGYKLKPNSISTNGDGTVKVHVWFSNKKLTDAEKGDPTNHSDFKVDVLRAKLKLIP